LEKYPLITQKIARNSILYLDERRIRSDSDPQLLIAFKQPGRYIMLIGDVQPYLMAQRSPNSSMKIFYVAKIDLDEILAQLQDL